MRRPLLLLLLSWVAFDAIAQTPPNDPQLTVAILAYTNSTLAEARLYNGTLYPGYDHRSQGHPFFLADTPLQASADYDGIFYPRLTLSYDLTLDAVIMPNEQRSALIQLLTGKLSSFTIGTHPFIFLQPDTNARNAPAPGFYEVLYAGKITALAHHYKLVKPIGRSEEQLSAFRPFDNWYLRIADRYLPVHNNKNLIDALGPGAASTIRSFLRNNKLNFKKDPAAALARTAEFLSQPTH